LGLFLAYPLQAARLVAPNRAKARFRRFIAPSGAARTPWAVWSCVLAAARGGTNRACAPVLCTPQRSSAREHFGQRLLCTNVKWEELGRRAVDCGAAARWRDTRPGEGLCLRGPCSRQNNATRRRRLPRASPTLPTQRRHSVAAVRSAQWPRSAAARAALVRTGGTSAAARGHASTPPNRPRLARSRGRCTRASQTRSRFT